MKMEKYNYWKEVANDVECWMDKDGDPFDLSQFEDREEAANYLYNELWDQDEITGNGGFFYDNEESCEEYLCHNIDLIIDACEYYYADFNILKKHYKKGTLMRYLDATIRCYVLGDAIEEALKTWEGYGFKYKGE